MSVTIFPTLALLCFRIHQIIVTGIHNNTQIIITSRPKGEANVSVDVYESYVYHTQYDFTGASVIASKLVSVLSAADCVDVPDQVCNLSSIQDKMCSVYEPRSTFQYTSNFLDGRSVRD